MLVDLYELAREADTNYLANEKLTALEDFSRSFTTRMVVYNKLKNAEEQILVELYRQVKSVYPTLLVINGKDVSAQCKEEIRFTFRQAVQAILLGEQWLRTNFLLWFQTIIQSLKLQLVCEVIYQTLENLLRASLPEAEGKIICPIIQTVRESLTVGLETENGKG